MSSVTSTVKLLQQELGLLYRLRNEGGIVLVFFLSIVALFPIALRQDPVLTLKVLPAALWISVMLALILALDAALKREWLLGMLDMYVLSSYPLAGLMWIKSTALWLAFGVPLTLSALLVAYSLGMPGKGLQALGATLCLGTPLLCWIGCFAASLTISLPRGGLLMTVLLLPLYIPVLLLSMSALEAALLGLPYQGQLALLLAGCCLYGTGMPFATAAAIKVSVT